MEVHMELTQSVLKDLLHYDPNTGMFKWITPPLGRFKSREFAGGIDGDGYWKIKVCGSHHRAHRLAFLYMNGAMPDQEVDHINGVRTDNRWENIRLVSGSENAKNKCLQKNNKSGITGVFWDHRKNKWTSKIMVNRTTIKLGDYTLFSKAVDARKRAEKNYGFHENHGRQP